MVCLSVCLPLFILFFLPCVGSFFTFVFDSIYLPIYLPTYLQTCLLLDLSFYPVLIYRPVCVFM